MTVRRALSEYQTARLHIQVIQNRKMVVCPERSHEARNPHGNCTAKASVLGRGRARRQGSVDIGLDCDEVGVKVGSACFCCAHSGDWPACTRRVECGAAEPCGLDVQPPASAHQHCRPWTTVAYQPTAAINCAFVCALVRVRSRCAGPPRQQGRANRTGGCGTAPAEPSAAKTTNGLPAMSTPRAET